MKKLLLTLVLGLAALIPQAQAVDSLPYLGSLRNEVLAQLNIATNGVESPDKKLVASLRKALTATALCGFVPIALSPLAGPLLDVILPKYAQAGTIALPVAIQAAIYLVQVPFTAALRGMQRVRSLFVQYVVFCATQATCLVVGTLAFDLRGAAWGMMAGSGVGLVTMIVLYRRALALLERAEPPATTPDAVSDENAGSTPVR